VLRYLGMVIIAAALTGLAGPHSIARSPDSALGATPGAQHLAVIVFENKSFSQVVGNSNAPYINNTLIPSGRMFTDYYSVTHPSLPDYLIITSGSDSGCVIDGCARNSIPGPSIFSEMNTAGISWHAYAESMTGKCKQGNSGAYLVRHNPPPYYQSIGGGGDKTCSADDVPYTQLATDIAAGHLPRFVWVTPNMYDDMHTDQQAVPCALGNATQDEICQGDTWLSNNLPALLSDGGRNDVAAVITWDEGVGTAGGAGQVPMIEVGAGVPPGVQVGTPLTHYGLANGIANWLGVPPFSATPPDL
jgi:phosphatidylinositol-3-phosphatase